MGASNSIFSQSTLLKIDRATPGSAFAPVLVGDSPPRTYAHRVPGAGIERVYQIYELGTGKTSSHSLSVIKIL